MVEKQNQQTILKWFKMLFFNMEYQYTEDLNSKH